MEKKICQSPGQTHDYQPVAGIPVSFKWKTPLTSALIKINKLAE